jgi:hypothetical protein
MLALVGAAPAEAVLTTRVAVGADRFTREIGTTLNVTVCVAV